MGWIDFKQLTVIQQRDFMAVNPRLGPKWENFRAWVKPNGEVSRSKGHWRWTAAMASTIDRAIKGALREVITKETPPTKDDLYRYSACTFHFAPEK